MALISKPDYTYIWASGGSVIEPSDTKKQTGWTAEVPPFQWENWIQNRQDQFIAHVNQRGIPQWDGQTEYEAGGLSYVQGTDGVVYKSVAASGPATTVQDPTTDVSDTYWTVAFADVGAFLTEVAADALYLRQDQNGADIDNAATFRTNIGVASAEASTAYSPGYFYGFTLANDGAAPNTTISVGTGAARDSIDSVNIKLTSTLRGILQSSGSWAAGDNQNKLDTGARANSTTYHVFAIRKTSDGTGDLLFSLSATTPTVPVGYSGFRRIGRIVTDGSGNIRAFKDRGNGRFDWITPSIEATTLGVAPTTILLTIPSMGGLITEMILQTAIVGDGVAIRLGAPDQTDVTTGVTPSDWTGGVVSNAGGGSATEVASGEFSVFGDSSGQIRVRTATSIGNCGYRIIVMGWRETR